MAIKILRKGLPVIGYAKIGEASLKTSKLKGAPCKWDHLELTGTVRDRDGRLIPDLELMRAVLEAGAPTCGGCERAKELGFQAGLPTRIGIYLPYDDPELVFPHRLAYYRGRTAYCVGDGETAERRVVKEIVEKGGKQLPVFGELKPHGPCGGECPDFVSRRCKPNGKLRFVLGIQQSVGGVCEFRTTSWNSIANLHEGLEEIRRVTGGVLQWIPLYLDLSAQTVQPADGSAASKAYIVRLTAPGGPQALLTAASEMLRLRAPVIAEVRQLEAQISAGEAWAETPEEAEAVEAEFYAEGHGEGDELSEEPPQEDAPEEEIPPAPAEAPSQPAPAARTAPPISEQQQSLLRAQADLRAKRLGLAEDAGSTILTYVLGARCIVGLFDVRRDEMNLLLSAIAAYKLPAEAGA